MIATYRMEAKKLTRRAWAVIKVNLIDLVCFGDVAKCSAPDFGLCEQGKEKLTIFSLQDAYV